MLDNDSFADDSLAAKHLAFDYRRKKNRQFTLKLTFCHFGMIFVEMESWKLRSVNESSLQIQNNVQCGSGKMRRMRKATEEKGRKHFAQNVAKKFFKKFISSSVLKPRKQR